MAIDQVGVTSHIRGLVADVAELVAAYAPSETDENALPSGLTDFPCAIVTPGATRAHVVQSGSWHSHDWEALVSIYVARPDLGEAANVAIPFPERFLALGHQNVTLGGRVSHFRFEDVTAISDLVYNAATYLGYQVTYLVREEAAITPAIGD